MQNTDITTKEADLNIVYGPHYAGNEVKELNLASVKYMFTDLTDIRKFYIRLGFHLHEFHHRCGFMDFGFATLYDFCEANLGLDKGAVSRCINVYREFNAKNDVKRIGNYESKGCAMDLSERWKDYSYTQLCEMLPLTDDQRKKVTPDMTIQQIRKYKKSLNDKPVASTQPDNPDPDSAALTQPEDSQDGPVASMQLFDFDEYENRKGIVRYNYVKKCEPVEIGRYRYLTLLDSRGAEVIRDVLCDILMDDLDCLVIRMCEPYNPAEPLEFDED